MIDDVIVYLNCGLKGVNFCAGVSIDNLKIDHF